jgi:ribosomal protein S18 acetylase RimI-like enzyme
MPESITGSISALDPVFVGLLDDYWAEFLGSSPEKLRKEKTQLLAHAELRDYAGCYIIEFGVAPIVSLPANEVESYREEIARWQPGVVRTPTVVQTAFRDRVEAVIGPAFIGYTDAKLFRQVTCGGARLLTNADWKELELLRYGCLAEEWDHGGSSFRPNEMVGILSNQRLVGVASYQVWGRHIAHISIITHPAFRGRGYATLAVSELTRIVLERKLVPQYRTLEANQPSMAVARQLGFVQYATSLAIRLRPPEAKISCSETA